MRDANLVLRDGTGNLTGSETGVYNNGSSLTSSGWLDIGKGGVQYALDFQIHVPQATGTSPTLEIAFQFSDDGTNVADYVDVTGAGSGRVTAAADLFKRVRTRHRYVRYALTVGGTTPNFGGVTIHGSTGLSYRDANISNS